MKKHGWKEQEGLEEVKRKMREMIRDGRIKVVGRQEGMPVELKILCWVAGAVGGFLLLSAIFGV